MVEYLDRYSRQDSWCHRLLPEVKISVVLSVTMLSVFVPAELWPVQGVLGGIVLAGLTLARIPLDYLIHRLVRFLPFVFLFCLSLWLGNRRADSGIIIVNLFLRSAVCFLAAIWLVNVTPFDTLLVTFKRIGFPRVGIALLAFMYRYVFVVFDELDRMQHARESRSFGKISFSRQWGLRGQMIGMLLVRGVSRAERIHGAMCARGWDGTIRRLDELMDVESTEDESVKSRGVAADRKQKL